MKLRNLALALSAAALLPTFAYAGSNMDAISASFDRDLSREYSVRYAPSTVTNAALLTGPEPVLASFERDLYREPVAFNTLPAGRDADPLDAINAALRCGNSATINASIASGHNSC